MWGLVYGMKYTNRKVNMAIRVSEEFSWTIVNMKKVWQINESQEARPYIMNDTVPSFYLQPEVSSGLFPWLPQWGRWSRRGQTDGGNQWYAVRAFLL